MPDAEAGESRPNGRDSPHRRTHDMDLYTDPTFTLMSPIGNVQGRSAFTGNQPDDGALIGMLATGDEICVLGTGFGASTRAILAARPSAHITCVDNDPRTLRLADEVTRRLCDQPRLNIVERDAYAFLAESERPWGGLVVDLYTATGYPDILLRPGFWRRVSEVSARAAAPVLVNTWGIPEQLEQFGFWNAHSTVGRLIEDVGGWSRVRVLPSRRNASLLLQHEDAGADAPAEDPPPDHLHRYDRAVLRAHRLRLGAARTMSLSRLPPPRPHDVSAVSSRAAQNDAMVQRWPAMARAVLAAARQVRAGRGRHPDTLREVLAAPELATAAMSRLAERGDPAATAIPVILAGEAQDHRRDAAWLLTWFRDNHADLIARTSPEFVIGCLLWQCVSIALSPHGVPFEEVSWFFDEVMTLHRATRD
ncbi:spermidine synthase [Gandjariella thermophila]|uniref:Methyltransferase domain-containing protein n=1 Tax=Gandjariella thermophila TaxID=1931992 RepID=A0A4D4JDZ6_9PSEU|nr:hypothetical protein [Gandjariella thermophila]GDY33854.1 hypothetical protein GTS_54870 [Gandjariella thermophila]